MDEMRVERASSLAARAIVVDAWGLRGAQPVVVLAGGAGAMDGASGPQRARGGGGGRSCPRSSTHGAALVTGGTDAGVMRIAGEARRAAGATSRSSGVVPADLVELPEAAAGAAPGSEASGRRRSAGAHARGPARPHPPAGRARRSTGAPRRPGCSRSRTRSRADAPAVTVVLNGGAIARAEIAESVRLGRRG